jgi:hypothetical protein
VGAMMSGPLVPFPPMRKMMSSPRQIWLTLLLIAPAATVAAGFRFYADQLISKSKTETIPG